MRNPKLRKPTIYDLAASTGASASTVSAVLNGSWRQRRIKVETAQEIQRAADAAGYSANMQARALRKSRSGLIGMIVPLHENRFFSALSQAFDAEARIRDLCPVIVSTLRDPEEERRTAETLVSYNVDGIIVAGATDPDSVSQICDAAGIRHVNVDLPGTLAPSVVSDNRWGAAVLTRAVIERARPILTSEAGRIYFIGGISSDHATRNRVAGFRAVHEELLGPVQPEQLLVEGYDPAVSEQQIRALHQRLGGLPAGLIVNSTIAFEGVIRFLKTLPRDAFSGCVIGCYDFDPFAAFLHFPVLMVQQDTRALIAEAFRLMDGSIAPPDTLIEIKPALIPY